MKIRRASLVIAVTFALGCLQVVGQPGGDPPRGEQPAGGAGQPERRGPFGGPGGPMGNERKLVAKYDKDGDGRLNTAERTAARDDMKANANSERQGPGGPGGPGGAGRRGFGPPGMGGDEKPTPGVHVEKSEVRPLTGGLYDTNVLRTIFIDFESTEWEDELSDFIKSDVEVPATLTVDGMVHPGVGVSFRGASSLMMVGKGSKRSLNISTDFTDHKQHVLGASTLNLLNSHEDASFMRTVLYLEIAKALHIPAPRANFVRVVINGENWGLYTNAQQFNKQMLAELFPKAKGEGSRWKAPGSPMGRGGLEYLGDDIAKYKQRYAIKSKDDERSWEALVKLCKTLSETPTEELEAALAPMLDIDGVLRFLALDSALVNSDGYWIRASDYSMYLDDHGVFHILPHDANETLSAGMGPGGPGMRGPRPPRDGEGGVGGPDGAPPRDREPGAGEPPRQPPLPEPVQAGRAGDARQPGGGQIDPLIGLDDSTKPLRSKLLKVPSLQARYLQYVREIADLWLDWKTLGPIVESHRTLIEDAVKADTKKLSSVEAFKQAVSTEAPAAPAAAPPDGERRRPGGRNLPLKQFADERRAFLLGYKVSTPTPERK